MRVSVMWKQLKVVYEQQKAASYTMVGVLNSIGFALVM